MAVIPDLEEGTMDMTAQSCIDKEAEVRTDAYSSYSLLSQTFAKHTVFNLSKMEVTADKLFPWVHIMISNAKRWLLGIHHQIGDKYLQNYLNEFCYKQNRRYFNERLFDRLLIAAASIHWKPRAQ